MVWILKGKTTKATYALLPKQTYVVGRLNTDIALDDKSVSRKHATLHLKALPSSADRSLPDYEVVLLETSKFGSFLNGTTSILGKEVVLNMNDEITFGQHPGVTFVLQRTPLHVFTSCLKTPDKRQLKSALEKLGGTMSAEWCPESSHLVMSSITVTFKVICGLLKALPIVTAQYFDALLTLYASKQDISTATTRVEDYQPALTDEYIVKNDVSFLPNCERQNLFANKIFIFLTKEKLDCLHPLVELGRAKCHLLALEKLQVANSAEEKLLRHRDSLLVHEQVHNALRSKAYAILKSCNRRPILDAEIGHAVLANSLDYYCNSTIPCDPHLYKDAVSSEMMTQNPFQLADTRMTAEITTASGSMKRSSLGAAAEDRGVREPKRPRVDPVVVVPKLEPLSERQEEQPGKRLLAADSWSPGRQTKSTIEDTPISEPNNTMMIAESHSNSIIRDSFSHRSETPVRIAPESESHRSLFSAAAEPSPSHRTSNRFDRPSIISPNKVSSSVTIQTRRVQSSLMEEEDQSDDPFDAVQFRRPVVNTSKAVDSQIKTFPSGDRTMAADSPIRTNPLVNRSTGGDSPMRTFPQLFSSHSGVQQQREVPRTIWSLEPLPAPVPSSAVQCQMKMTRSTESQQTNGSSRSQCCQVQLSRDLMRTQWPRESHSMAESASSAGVNYKGFRRVRRNQVESRPILLVDSHDIA